LPFLSFSVHAFSLDAKNAYIILIIT
jgi:hypothetical protein